MCKHSKVSFFENIQSLEERHLHNDMTAMFKLHNDMTAMFKLHNDMTAMFKLHNGTLNLNVNNFFISMSSFIASGNAYKTFHPVCSLTFTQ